MALSLSNLQPMLSTTGKVMDTTTEAPIHMVLTLTQGQTKDLRTALITFSPHTGSNARAIVAQASRWATMAADKKIEIRVLVAKPEALWLRAKQHPQGKSRGRMCRYQSPDWNYLLNAREEFNYDWNTTRNWHSPVLSGGHSYFLLRFWMHRTKQTI